jgi:hypothetical protein
MFACFAHGTPCLQQVLVLVLCVGYIPFLLLCSMMLVNGHPFMDHITGSLLYESADTTIGKQSIKDHCAK